jgi:hypothetical protein
MSIYNEDGNFSNLQRVNRDDFKSDDDYLFAKKENKKRARLISIGESNGPSKSRKELHTLRMQKLGHKLTYQEKSIKKSIVTSDDVVIRPYSDSDDFLHIGSDVIQTGNASGTGGFKMTPQKALIKKSMSFEIENDYREMSMGNMQFNQNIHDGPSSVIKSDPLIDFQLFPKELKQLSGLAKKIKGFLGF